MQIILASGLLLMLAVLLVHQFWTHSLDDELEGEDELSVLEPDASTDELKAA